MFSKVAIFTAVFAAFVAAAPLNNSCNSGPVQCCNQVQNSQSTTVTELFALLGLALPDATAQVGLSCSPITALGISGNSCSSQPVCCENNNFNGLVAVGCSPINANL